MGSELPHDVDLKSGYCAATGIYYSKRDPVVLPDDPFCTVPALVLAKPDYDHRTAYIDGATGRRLSYWELRQAIRLLASGLAGFGVQKGDVVLLLLPNCIHFSAIMFGVMSIGGIVTTTNPLNTSAEIAKQMKDSAAKFVCTVPDLVEKVNWSELPLILVNDGQGIDDTVLRSSTASRRYTSLSDLLQSDPSRVPSVRIRQDDIAALLYSSGTTGPSKGVIITHRNLIAQRFLLLGDDGTSWTDRIYLCFIPMFHVYGLAMFASGLLAKGCTTVIMSKFDIMEMLKLIQLYRVTHMPVVPPILVALAKLKVVEQYDTSSLVQIGSGAAPLSKEVEDSFRTRFPNVIVTQGYALTETTCVGATLSADDIEDGRHGSTGFIAANMEAKIVDPNSGKFLPPNNQGEIWLRGPTIMKGYFSNPDATAAILDSEGWLHTGDLGYIDKEGYVYVVDRLKELIKYKGLQIAPAELESVLISHREIVDAAVIPYPDEDAGQIPLAFIVKSPQSTLTEVGVINFVAGQVAPYKKVRRVAFVNSIPKSSSGKILRQKLILQVTSKL